MLLNATKESVIARITTHNGILAIIFEAKDYYGIMAEECFRFFGIVKNNTVRDVETRTMRFRPGLSVAAMVNCADTTGAKNMYIIFVKGIKGRLNRLPSACVGDMVMATV
ncbi:hypothetical protein H5410_027682 [Solanum commersonii]|uniref:Uncharacterized protein n=1 Tax=Solanum commersonii TaxID=4109 RepID=A0A9J5Z567_SOLCO|nr:hypothetical protein H5410_027682 [Solanum commersonii]